MTTSQQLMRMVRSHVSGDAERFLSIAEEIAGEAERAGRAKFAGELQQVVQDGRSRLQSGSDKPTALAALQNRAKDLVSAAYSTIVLEDLVVADDLAAALRRIARENQCRELLACHGLAPRRRILLVGPPGTGKTMTAAAIAGELAMPLFTVMHQAVITKYMGETSAKLGLVFEAMAQVRGVYFFDEVDAFAASRAETSDVGEARRFLTAFLQFLETTRNESLVIAATNEPQALDSAVFRRFDAILTYSKPTLRQCREILARRLELFASPGFDLEAAASAAQSSGISQSELVSAASDAARSAVLDGGGLLTTGCILEAINAIAVRRSIRADSKIAS